MQRVFTCKDGGSKLTTVLNYKTFFKKKIILFYNTFFIFSIALIFFYQHTHIYFTSFYSINYKYKYVSTKQITTIIS